MIEIIKLLDQWMLRVVHGPLVGIGLVGVTCGFPTEYVFPIMGATFSTMPTGNDNEILLTALLPYDKIDILIDASIYEWSSIEELLMGKGNKGMRKYND